MRLRHLHPAEARGGGARTRERGDGARRRLVGERAVAELAAAAAAPCVQHARRIPRRRRGAARDADDLRRRRQPRCGTGRMWYVSATPSASSAQPQTSTEPPASTAALWYAPAPTATIAFSSSIRRGAARSSSQPWPSSPSAPRPHEYTLPDMSSASVWKCEHAIAFAVGRLSIEETAASPPPSAELAVRVAAPREGRGGAGAAARRCFLHERGARALAFEVRWHGGARGLAFEVSWHGLRLHLLGAAAPAAR